MTLAPQSNVGPGSLKDDAEALRVGLITGLVTAAEVVRWADSIIGDDRGDEAPSGLDLSLSGRAPLAELVSLLSAVPGHVENPQTVGRRLALQLHGALSTNDLDVVQVARAMYRLMLDGYAPDNDFENTDYVADDDVDHALNDQYISIEEVREYLLEFLERYALAHPAGSGQ